MISLTGQDTIVIDDRVLADLADGNCVEITFPNELAAVKTGKNGNAIYAENMTGQNADLKIRVLAGSPDDKYLNNRYMQQINDFSSFILVTGEFVKKVGDGSGNLTSINYSASSGVFTKGVEAKNNVEGDTEQSVAIYSMRFALAPRSIS